MGIANLGIALGAATDEYRAQRADDRLDAAETRAQAAEGRQAQQFAWQQGDHARKTAVEGKRDAIMSKFTTDIDDIEQQFNRGDTFGAAKRLSDHHNRTNYLGDSQSTVVKGGDGKHYIVHYKDGQRDGASAQVQEVTPQLMQEHLAGMVAHQMMGADPDSYLQNYQNDRKMRQGDANAAAETTKAAAAKQQAETQEGYRADQKPVLAAQAGLYGSQARYYDRMPHDSGRGGGQVDPTLSAQERNLLGGIMDRYAAEQDPGKRAKIAQEYQMAQSRIMLGRGKVPNLPGGMVKNERPVDPEEMKALTAELQGLGTKFTPAAETVLRQKYPNAAARVFGEDPILAAAGKMFDGAPKAAPARGLQIPAPAKASKPWYETDAPSNVTNSDGAPNVIANGLNSVHNFFARSARAARSE